MGVHAPNVASTPCKDLSHLTCFNSDKKGHYVRKYPETRKDRDTSEDQRHLKRLVTSLGNLRIDKTNMNSIQGGYSRTSSANEFRASSILPSSKRTCVSSTQLGNERCRCRLLHAQQSLRLRKKAMPVTYKLHPDIRSSRHIYIITTFTS